MNARSFFRLMWTVVFALCFLAGSAVAQRDFDDVKIEAVDLGGGIHMLKGAGGNLVQPASCLHDIVEHVADMSNWRAHAERMFAREATWKCRHREGVTAENISYA